MTPRILPLALLLLVPCLASAQGTAADYDRAAKLYGKTKDKLSRARVVPHSLEGGKRFWYRNDLSGKAREWLLVVTATGERGPAFDHAKLAAALSKETNRELKATHLPLEEVRVAEGKIEFRAYDKVWAYDLATGTLTLRATIDKYVSIPDRRPEGRKVPPPKYGAFIKDSNVYLRNLKTKEETRLSKDGKPGDSYEGRFHWSPDGKRLVVLRTKAGGDREVTLVESSPKDSLTPKVHTFPYLKPGDAIPLSKPHLFDIAAKKEIPIADDLFPNPWSLDDFHWQDDGERFFFVYNQRGHQVMRVVAVDAKTGEASAVVDEVSKTFIDYAGKEYLHWLPETDELIWMSERDGWNHLYLYDTKTGKVKSQITKGDWAVRGVDRIDEKARRVWFHAGGIDPKQDPYNVHYAHVSFDGIGLVRLTEGDGTHSVAVFPDRKHLIDTYSRVDLAPVTELRRVADGKLVRVLEKADTSALEATGWKPPERFVAKGRDGKTDIWGVIIRPTNFDPKKKYPVIEDIYAGPQRRVRAEAVPAVLPLSGDRRTRLHRREDRRHGHVAPLQGVPRRLLEEPRRLRPARPHRLDSSRREEVPRNGPVARRHLRRQRRRAEFDTRPAGARRLLQGRRQRLRLPRQPRRQDLVERVVDGLARRPALPRAVERHERGQADGQIDARRRRDGPQRRSGQHDAARRRAREGEQGLRPSRPAGRRPRRGGNALRPTPETGFLRAAPARRRAAAVTPGTGGRLPGRERQPPSLLPQSAHTRYSSLMRSPIQHSGRHKNSSIRMNTIQPA